MPILLITVLGAALRFIGIGHQGFWYDEAYTSFLLKYSSGHMLGLLPHLESTPPLYYCVAWIWARVFGNDPAGLRSLSALCGTATIPVVYATARKLLANRRSAVIAAALVAFNPLLIWYSQEARAYSMLVLTSALTLLAFAHALDVAPEQNVEPGQEVEPEQNVEPGQEVEPGPKVEPGQTPHRPRALALGTWAVACALALTTHYYAVLVVTPEAVWLLYKHRHNRAVKVAVAAVVLVGLALLPLLISQTRTGNDDWIAKRSLGLRLGQVLPLFLIGTGTHLRLLTKYVTFAAALVGVAAFIWRTPRLERQGGLLPGGIALVGFLIAATVGESTLLTRNLLAIMVPLALFLAAGLGASRARLTGIAATTVLCAAGVFATISIASDYHLERPNWRPLAAALGPWPQSLASGSVAGAGSGSIAGAGSGSIASAGSGSVAGSGSPVHGTRLVIVMNNPGLLPLGLYLNGLTYDRSRTIPDVTVIDMVAVADFHGQGTFCWWGAACNLTPSGLSRRFHPTGFRIVRKLRVEQFRVIEMVATGPHTISVGSLPTSNRHELNAFIRDGHGNLNDAYLIQRA